jgi:hypothetical protein
MLELLTDVLKRLRKLADEHAQTFRSDGFRGLLATLSRELDDDYLRTVEGAPARAQVPPRRPDQRRARPR